MKLRGTLIALLVLASGMALGQSLPSKTKLLRVDSIWIYQRMNFSAMTPSYVRPGDVYYKDDTLWVVTSAGTFALGPGGSGLGTWGTITGTLSAQTDLQAALNAKQDSSTSLIWSDTTASLATAFDISTKLNSSDTASLSARIYLKADSSLALYWSDTTIANTGLVTQNDLAAGLSAKQAYADSSSWDATRTWVAAQGYEEVRPYPNDTTQYLRGDSTWSAIPSVAGGDITAVNTSAPLSGGATTGAVTLALDTTTTAGLATQYDISLKEPTITAGVSGDYYWNGNKTWQPFTSGVRSLLSGQAGQINYNSTNGIFSLVPIDTVSTITSGTWNGDTVGIQFGGTGGNSIATARAKLLPNQSGASGKVLRSSGTAGGETWEAITGTGTVTSVGLTLPTAVFDVSNSPVTTLGTLTATFDNQTANTVFSGPSSGAAASPAFRALTFSDMTSAWFDSLVHYNVNTTGLGAGDALIFDGSEWNAQASVAINVSANKPAQMNATGDTLVDSEARLDSSSTGGYLYAKNDTVVASTKFIYDVKMYNAVGDSVTNDSSAVMSAITAAGATGGAVFFPEGKYYVGTLYIPSNVELFGEGDSSVLIAKTNATDGIIAIDGTDSIPENNPRNVHIHDLRLHSTPGTFSQSVHQIRVGGVTGLLIERVTFEKYRGDGVYLGRGTSTVSHNQNVTIRNCRFDGVTHTQRNAISVIDGYGVMIENNYFTRSGVDSMPGGVDVEPNGATDRVKNITIRNNRFFDVRGNIGVIALVLENQATAVQKRQGFVVEGNYIDSCYGSNMDGIQVIGETAVNDSTVPMGIVIRNNVVRRTERPVSILGAHTVLVEGNVFDDITEYGYIGYTTSVDSTKNVRFVNNAFNRVSNGEGRVFIIGASRYLAFDGNTFTDCGLNTGGSGTLFYFITSTSYSNVSISNNRIVNPTGRTTAVAASTTPVTDATTNILTGNQFGALSTTLFPHSMEIKPDRISGGIPIEYAWALDSTVLVTYGTTFNRTWFKAGADSMVVDSLTAVSYNRANGDTVSVRVLWGASRATPSDSLSDLKCYHSAGGVAASSTKVIPPNNWVWVKITEEDGDAKEIAFAIKGRKKTP